MNEYIIEMNNVTKRFPGVIANDDISIQIKKGEIFALLGENGAGKSTLMSMLFGIYEPDEGEIIIRGEKVRLSSAKSAADLNIGMVHQHFKLVSNFTIAQNIILGKEPIRKVLGLFPYVNVKYACKNIRELSKKYNLEVEPSQKIENVSVSVQQRVEILKMLYCEAEILIFDEPTAILTPQEIEYLLGIMKELKNQGKTIILITHKLEEVKKIADRCAVLRQGKLIKVLDVASTTTKELANLMVGRDVIFNMQKRKSDFSEAVLSVKGLTVENADRLEVVKDVSFSIRGGEIFALAGVSGNGQVEIAEAIAGMIDVKTGSITLNGKDITPRTIRERSLEGISYIPEDRQKFGVIMDFDLCYNLALKKYFAEPFSKRGILQKEEFDAYAMKLIGDYDIRHGQGTRTKLRSMSGGNQQKVIIAREIELDSSLMIFVQPTRGLDIGAIETVHRQILLQRDRGKAILLISLELDEIVKLADTIGVIFNGQLLKVAPAQSLSISEVGKYMMGVKQGEQEIGK
ncbi:MAG: ABC transporter ATP-binding protein [Dethiobacteria bacterium]